MWYLVLACAPGPDPAGKYGNPAQLASIASDFVLVSRNGVDAQTFTTYNAAPANDSIGLWDSSFGNSVNPNGYRIVVSVGSDGLIDVVRPYGTSGSVTIPSGGYVVQGAGTSLPFLSGLAVDDELGVRSSSACTAPGVPVLLYHSIGSSGSALDAHLQALDEAGYETITLGELGAFLDGPSDCDPILPDKPIVLTFDDGYADQFASAPALLDAYGMVATFFIITSYPGTSTTWASWSAISDAVAAYPDSVELGCHSHAAHVQVGGVAKYLTSGFDVAADLATCRSTLLSHTGVDTTALAWPFGSYTAALTDIAADAGFDLMLNTWPGINVPENDDAEGNVRRFGVNVTSTWAATEASMNRWVVCP